MHDPYKVTVAGVANMTSCRQTCLGATGMVCTTVEYDATSKQCNLITHDRETVATLSDVNIVDNATFVLSESLCPEGKIP